MIVQPITIDKDQCDAITAAVFPGGPLAPCALLPASAFKQWDHAQVRAVLQLNARYLLPTVELIEFLKNEIVQSPIFHPGTIEIGAGMGDLGYHLGITMTDSYVQCENAAVALHYAMLGIPPTTPPKNAVAKMEARRAIERYKPRCVIGAWVTQQFKQHHVVGESEAFTDGIDEEWIVDHVEKYIMIGNLNVHGKKDILGLPHEEHFVPGIVSRGADPTKDVVFIWGKP